jgi:hypothetical protein
VAAAQQGSEITERQNTNQLKNRDYEEIVYNAACSN